MDTPDSSIFNYFSVSRGSVACQVIDVARLTSFSSMINGVSVTLEGMGNRGRILATQPDDDFDLLAAALRADMRDIALWFSVLATKLAGALPDRVTVRHAGFLGNGPVNAIAADLGEWHYALRLEHGQLLPERTHTVRGIALKTERLALDAWIAAIATALAELAATSARERDAIARLLQQ